MTCLPFLYVSREVQPGLRPNVCHYLQPHQAFGPRNSYREHSIPELSWGFSRVLSVAVETQYCGQELEATLELSEEGTGLTSADLGFLRQENSGKGVW